MGPASRVRFVTGFPGFIGKRLVRSLATAAQLPIDEKAARADFVVENQGPIEAHGQKAERLLGDLRQGRGRKLPNASPLRY